MPKFRFDARTGGMKIVEESRLSPAEVLILVKRRHYNTIRSEAISDKKLKDMIEKVRSGTRNIRYLVEPTDSLRYRDIVYTVLRELTL